VPFPDVIDFGTVRTGCRSETRQVRLVNFCSTPLNTTFATTLTGSTAFSADAGVTRTIAPGESTAYDIEYRPTAVGQDVALLNVSQPLGVTLIGRGAATSATTETFVVPARADVLFVIDDSCSMQDKQDALSNNLTAFLAAAPTDWGLAVTTTDDVTGGQLASSQGTNILRPSNPGRDEHDHHERRSDLHARRGSPTRTDRAVQLRHPLPLTRSGACVDDRLWRAQADHRRTLVKAPSAARR